jgi:hypothetical protein
MTTPSPSPSAEERLRDVLGTLADQVSASPEAYRRAEAEWRRRERRRRTVVIALASVLIAVADVVGLWALNNARSGAPVVFDGPPPAKVQQHQAP